MKILAMLLVLLLPLLFIPLLQIVNAFHENLDHDSYETCFTIALEHCKQVTEKAKTETVFLPRCIVTLGDGNEITVYKLKETCLDWQTKYGGMTYEQYQDDAMTEFNNKANEARENVGKMFAPDSPFSPSLSDKIDELTEKIDELNAGR